MSDTPTISELRKAAAVTDEQINAAVDAFLADAATGRFELANGVVLDLSEVVRSHRQAATALDDAEATQSFRRTMVRTAILLARTQPA